MDPNANKPSPVQNPLQTPQTEQPVQQQPSSTQHPSKSPNKLLMIIGVLTVLFLTLVGGYAVLQSQTQKPTPTPTVVQSKPSPIPTIATTAIWKTYTNVMYEYEIKYPSDIVIQVENPQYPNFVYKPKLIDQSDWFSLSIRVVSIPKNQTAEQYFRNHVEGRRKNNILHSGGDKQAQEFNNKRAESSLNSIKPYTNNVISGIITSEEGVGYADLTVFHATVDKLYQFELIPRSSTDPIIKNTHRKYLDQILSTFRFSR